MSFLRKMSILLTVLLLSVSCGRMVQRRVAVESVESFERLGWSGVDVTLTVRNDLRRDIALDSCRVAFILPSGILARAELRGGASIERQTTADVRLRFKIVSENFLALQFLWLRMASGETDDTLLDIEAVVRIGGRQHKIYAPARNLSEILRKFGVSEDDFPTRFQ